MGWGSTAVQHAQGSGGKFLKLKEKGSKASVIVMDEPAMRLQLYSKSANKYFMLDDSDIPRDAAEAKSFPVWVFNVNEGISQILSMSPGLFRDVHGFIENHCKGNPKAYVLNIVRTGTGKETRWSISRDPATEEQLKAAEQADPWDPVEEDKTGATVWMSAEKAAPVASSNSSTAEDDDVPF